MVEKVLLIVNYSVFELNEVLFVKEMSSQIEMEYLRT